MTGHLRFSLFTPIYTSPAAPPRNNGMTGKLLFDLTSPVDADGFPATELSERLLKYAGHDVVQFRRNQQIAYHLVEQTRDAYERIVPIIRQIENSPSTEDSLEDFVRYTDAVDALEK